MQVAQCKQYLDFKLKTKCNLCFSTSISCRCCSIRRILAWPNSFYTKYHIISALKHET